MAGVSLFQHDLAERWLAEEGYPRSARVTSALARELGVHRNTLQRALDGQCQPDATTALQLARLVACPLEALYLRPVVSATISGNPGDGAINAAYKPGVRRRKKVAGCKKATYATLVKTDRRDRFAARARMVLRSARGEAKLLPLVRLYCRVYWPRRRHLPGVESLAYGDVDACDKAILDAVEAAEIVDDDTRVDLMAVSKHVDPDNPRIEVRIYAV